MISFTTIINSFELITFELGNTHPVLCVLVYRPPKFNKDFIEEWSELLAEITTKYERALIMGDFNVHICCPAKPLVKDFTDTLDSFGLKQVVSVPTHNQSHILDLVMFYGINVNNLSVDETVISDHFPVLFDFDCPVSLGKRSVVLRQTRVITPATADRFCASFTELPASTLFYTNPDDALRVFHSACLMVMDTIAPLKVRRPKPKFDPWLNSHTHELRRLCRRCERKWKKDKLSISHELFRNALDEYQKAVRNSRNKYFASIISTHSGNQRALYKTLNAVLSSDYSPTVAITDDLCSQFLSFFLDKVSNIRSLIISPGEVLLPASVCTGRFDHFEPITLPALERLISSMKPSGCPDDIVPARLFQEVLPVVAPHVLNIINSSLVSGIIPSVFKHAVLQPLLKKSGLDPTDLGNFRPISKLPFLSKVMEKVVYNQIMPHLNNFGVLDKFQSGFRQYHSTESAHIRVFNDIILATDSGSHVALVMLDLSAAFDTVDHDILLSRLENLVGIKGSALDWFCSYFDNRSIRVRMDDCSSPSAALPWGVPQGSILGPLLFSIYIIPLGLIFRKFNINFHLYADDCQIYVPLKAFTSIQPLLDCLSEVKDWLSANFLLLNDFKTEFIVFTPNGLSSSAPDFSALPFKISQTIVNLGIKMDVALKMDPHVNQMVKSCFYQLRRLSKLKPILNRRHLETTIHAFITSRLDYSNAILFGISKAALSRLQLIQNATARFLTNTGRRQHITPILARLHWLPVHYRIRFKILLFVFKALNGLAPPYISELLTPYVPGRTLRSGDLHLLKIPRQRCKTRGERAFSVCAPKLWNDLPLHIRLSSSIGVFKSHLKTYFYSLAFIT
uniref:Reverse transcriptase domain-containing protein n=1 Tax=Nothobranchius furzeri TaxID=105023 RepID=A0A8C6Q3C2_NOTFU